MNIAKNIIQTDIFMLLHNLLNLTIPEIQGKVKMNEKIVEIDTELMWKILSKFAETKSFFDNVKAIADGKQAMLERIDKE